EDADSPKSEAALRALVARGIIERSTPISPESASAYEPESLKFDPIMPKSAEPALPNLNTLDSSWTTPQISEADGLDAAQRETKSIAEIQSESLTTLADAAAKKEERKK